MDEYEEEKLKMGRGSSNMLEMYTVALESNWQDKNVADRVECLGCAWPNVEGREQRAGKSKAGGPGVSKS